jgi:hypothetical protein
MAALRTALVGTRTHLMRWLGDKPDDVALRALFALLLAVTAGLLVVDFNELGVNGPVSTTAPVAPIPQRMPSTALPAIKRADRVDPSVPLPRFDDKLRAPMTFDLGAGVCRGNRQARELCDDGGARITRRIGR